MANNLPWSLRGVDPAVREAVKAAARKAGMSVAEWLEQASQLEARSQTLTDGLDDERPRDLTGRVRKLSQSSSQSALGRGAQSSTSSIDALIAHAARLEARARETEEKTTSALESIIGWIEKAEGRMSASERAAHQRQEMTASVIADAIKTVSSRVSDVERRTEERRWQQDVATQQVNGRPQLRPAGLSRDNLAAAVSDIRSRQRALDAGAGMNERGSGTVLPFGERRVSERRAEVTPLMNELRADLSQLRQEIASLAPTSGAAKLEESIRELARRLEQRDQAPQLGDITRPLARIEAEIARLQAPAHDDRLERIEHELRMMGDRIESIAAGAQEPRILSAAMKEISGLRDAVSKANLSPQIDDLNNKIASLVSDFGRVRDTGREGIEDALVAMREALTRESREMSGISNGLLQRIAIQMETVANAIAVLPAGGLEEDERAEIAALSRKLDQLALRTQPESDDLASKIEQLAIRLDDMSQTGSRELIDRIERLSDQIEALGQRGAGTVERHIDALTNRIEALIKAHKLDAMTGGSTFVDLSSIESMISDLSRRMDDVRQPDAGPSQIEALERQIARLTERLDTRPDVASSHGALERTLSDLVRSLGGLREETNSAVDRAARAAAENVASRGGAGPSLDADHFSMLRQDLAGLRDVHTSIDERTNTALNAVNSTLETIMRRISLLESEVVREKETGSVGAPPMSEPQREAPRAARWIEDPLAETPVRARGRVSPSLQHGQPETAETVRSAPDRRAGTPAGPSEAPGPQPAPQRVPAHAAATGSAESDNLADMPLEPGSGRPGGRGDRDQAIAPSTAAALNPNLIAAARRAAQAATAEAAALKGEDKKNAGKSGRPRGSALSLKETFEKRRKPILLGLAAIVLAIGAGQVVTTLLDDTPPPRQAAPVERPANAPSTPTAAPNGQAPPQDPAAARSQRSELPSPDTTGSLPAPAAQPPPGATRAQTPEAAPATQTREIAALPPANASGAEGAGVIPGRVTNLGEIPAGLGTPGMRRAAEAGDPNAVFELASRAADGVGFNRDPRLALRLFERAAAAGFAPAQFRVGNIYEKGIGAPRDTKLAVTWYKRAAERGNSKAMHNLAVLLAEGADGRPDFAGAAEMFRKAAELGVRDSQYNLAILLGRGLGTEQDLSQAYFWFAVAARQGDTDAARRRDEVGTKLNPAELAAARNMAQSWKPKASDAIANDAVAPAEGWDPKPANPRPQQPRPRST